MITNLLRLFFILCWISIPLFAQNVPAIKSDDFTAYRSWWVFHEDGTVANDPRAIENGNGYLKIRLKNPQGDRECNVGISEARPLYSKHYSYLEMETRIRLLTPMKPGSRGWGFWKTAKDGRARYLSWFMEQQMPDNPEFSWNRIGVIDKNRIFIRPVEYYDDQWHVYRVVRDLEQGVTRFFIDGKQIDRPVPFAPRGTMAFHLWIDNQIYSRSRGVQRRGWQGESALIVDYVTIRSRRTVMNDRRLLHNGDIIPLYPTAGKNALIVCCSLEDLSPYDKPDAVRFTGKNIPPVTMTSTGVHTRMIPFDVSATRPVTLNAEVNGGPTLEALESVAYDSVLFADNRERKLRGEENIYFETPGGHVTVAAVFSVTETEKWDHFIKNPDGAAIILKVDNAPQDVIDGNITFGHPVLKTLPLQLTKGKHKLTIKSRGAATLYGLWIFEH